MNTSKQVVAIRSILEDVRAQLGGNPLAFEISKAQIILDELQKAKAGSDYILSGYYVDELAKIDPTKSKYAPKIQIRDGEQNIKTNHLDLNAESAAALRHWLNMYYPEG